MNVGDRVAIDPGTDLWMMGIRYASIIQIGRKWVYIDATPTPFFKKTYKILPELLTVVRD